MIESVQMRQIMADLDTKLHLDIYCHSSYDYMNFSEAQVLADLEKIKNCLKHYCLQDQED